MKSRLTSALLLASAVALLVAGAMVARAATWPDELQLAKPATAAGYSAPMAPEAPR